MVANDELRKRAHEEWEAGNLKAAFDLFERAAGQGDREAQFSLGYFYDYGIGVEEDPIKGMFWSLRSGEEDEIGPYEDELDYLRKTFEKMKRDAEQGKDTSLLNLGYFYAVGLGVAADKEQAMFWYLKALESGDTVALVNIAILYREKATLRRRRNGSTRPRCRATGTRIWNWPSCIWTVRCRMKTTRRARTWSACWRRST